MNKILQSSLRRTEVSEDLILVFIGLHPIQSNDQNPKSVKHSSVCKTSFFIYEVIHQEMLLYNFNKNTNHNGIASNFIHQFSLLDKYIV